MFLSLASTIAGIILICIGVSEFLNPAMGINLMTLQPVVINGTTAFLGFVFLMAGGYRLIFGKKAFDKERESKIQHTIEDERKRLKDQRYAKKDIQKMTKLNLFK